MRRSRALKNPIALLLALAALTLAAITAAGCGGDSASSEEGASGGEAAGTTGGAADQFPATHTPPDDAAEGGALTVLTSGDVDSLDPGATYDQLGYMVAFATQRSLMGWPPDATDMPVPDLADGDPEITDEGRTLTFTIEDGVSYGPPVNREVRAEDFEYAIERSLMPGVANGYISTYMSSLVGFDNAVAAVEENPTEAPDIRGVEASDEVTLELRFREPDAITAMQVLSLPLGAPVPAEYARELDSQSPSAYGQNVVATGPYMVENNAQGKLTGYVPGESITLVRNPNWDSDSDFRPAYLDRIELQEGFENAGPAIRQIVEGESMVNGAVNPDPPVLEEVATEHPDLLALAPQGGNRYVTLNTQLAPFDDINLRKAVLAATDREAMRLSRGGAAVGPIANHFIPPGMMGFEEAGGYEGTGADFLAEPSGDPELAAEYMRKAGFESGKYEGDEQVLMVGADGTVERATAEIVRDTLESLGFDVNYRTVSIDAMYSRFCTVPDAEVAVCPNIGWLKDFNHPRTILEPTFSGEAIAPTNNPNISQLDVQEINRAMEEANDLTDPQEVAEAWGEIDRMVTAQAPAVPWAWDHFPVVSSPDVENVINTFSGNTDLSHTSLESP